MKKFVLFTPLIMFFIVFLTSCEYDNYEEPKSRLYGKIVYQDEPINVGFNEVSFELWEPGWQLKVPINVIVAPDGFFPLCFSMELINLRFLLGKGHLNQS